MHLYWLATPGILDIDGDSTRGTGVPDPNLRTGMDPQAGPTEDQLHLIDLVQQRPERRPKLGGVSCAYTSALSATVRSIATEPNITPLTYCKFCRIAQYCKQFAFEIIPRGQRCNLLNQRV